MWPFGQDLGKPECWLVWLFFGQKVTTCPFGVYKVLKRSLCGRLPRILGSPECWLVRLFFGATVAFSIPISKMLTFTTFWKGFVVGVGPCIFTKIISGIFTGRVSKMHYPDVTR